MIIYLKRSKEKKESKKDEGKVIIVEKETGRKGKVEMEMTFTIHNISLNLITLNYKNYFA